MFAKWPIPGLRKGRYKRSLACFVEPWCKEVLRVCAGAAMEEEPARGGSQWPDWASWVLEWTRTRVDYNPLNEIESRSSYLQWWREREGKAFPWSWMLTQSRTKDGTSKLLPLTLLGLIDSGRNIKMLHWGVPWQLSRLRIWRGCSWVAAVVRVPGPETYTHTHTHTQKEHYIKWGGGLEVRPWLVCILKGCYCRKRQRKIKNLFHVKGGRGNVAAQCSVRSWTGGRCKGHHGDIWQNWHAVGVEWLISWIW